MFTLSNKIRETLKPTKQNITKNLYMISNHIFYQIPHSKKINLQ